MPVSDPTFFQDDLAVIDRAAEVTDASFANGISLGGSNAPGVGINMNQGAVVGTPEQFTLLDQRGIAREAQISQSIGGFPSVPRDGNQAFTWDATQALYTAAGAASSGGTVGVLPEAVIQFGTLPTQAAKDADPALDGTIAVTLGNSTLTSLAAGWVVNV